MSETGDPIQIYLKEIGAIPLLSREEEMELACLLKDGDEEAGRKLVRANLRLVVTIVKRYMNLGLSFLDLVEEGNLGLMKAVEKFDIEKGCKLSTYASWWIKQSVIRALANQAKMIRLPVYMVEKVSALNTAMEVLHKRMGRQPTIQELADYMDEPVDRIDELLTMSRSPKSLEGAISDDGVSELIDVIADRDSVNPKRAVAERMVQDNILEILSRLSEREAKIVSWRFGLLGSQPMTLEDIGQRLGVTRERVRQIAESAVAKMRDLLKEKNLDYQDF